MKQRMWPKLQNWEKGWNLREGSSAVLSVSRWLMSEVSGSCSWHQKFRGWQNVWPRQRPGSTWNVTEASNMLRMELRNPFGSEISAATVCQAECWLLEFYFSAKIRRQPVAKMSLIKGSQRPFDRDYRKLVLLASVRKHPSLLTHFWTLQTLPEDNTVHALSIFTVLHRVVTRLRIRLSPTEHIKFDWVIGRRQNEEHIWILKPLFSRRNHLEFNCVSIALAYFFFFFSR